MRTLIVGPSWVGDMVMAQSLFMVLKGRNPDMAIDVLAPDWSRPLLARMSQVQEAISMPLRHGELGLAKRYRLGCSLRGRYDRAIVLPNSFKSALVPFYARIPQRIGYVGEMRWGVLTDARWLDKKRLPRTTDRFIALGLNRQETLPDFPPVPALQRYPGRVCATFRGHSLPLAGGPILVLCPGAEYGPAKCWPEEYFKVLAKTCAHAGWRIWVLGTEKEVALGAAIAAAAGSRGFNLAGQTSLDEAVDLISFADAVVTNDSGLMHVAAALKRPVVAIFGSSDPRHTPPLHPQAQVLSLALACAPCFKRHCPLGHLKCLRDIHPEMVLERLALVGAR